MAAFERWVMAKAQELYIKGPEAEAERARLEQFLMRRRLDPAFDAEILRLQLAEPKFLAHRKVMIDAILASVIDGANQHGTIKALTSAPVTEAKQTPRPQALGGRYTERQIRTILTDEYPDIARQPTERAGREAPYRTVFTPDDYAPEHLRRFRENLDKESKKLGGKELRDAMRACDDLRRVRPHAVADLRTFRDQVAASLAQLVSHPAARPEMINSLREHFFPCHPLLTIFYDHLMMAIGGAWFARKDDLSDPGLLGRSLTFWFSEDDAKRALSDLADLTQSVEAAYLYGYFAALSLDKIGKNDPCIHLWTALSKMPNVPDEQRAVALHNRSTPYLRVGAYRQAAEDIHKATDLFDRAGKRYQVAVGLKCEAEARYKLSERQNAMHLYQRALAVAGELTGNDRFGAYWNLACSHRRIGDLPTEAAYLDACLKVLDERDERQRDVALALKELVGAGVRPTTIPLLEEQFNTQGGDCIKKMTKSDSQRIQSTTKEAGFARRAQSAGDKNK